MLRILTKRIMKKKSAKINNIKFDNDYPKIGQFLRHLRNKFRLTQAYIAEVVGLSRPTLNKIESDKAELTLFQAKKLADFYNISLSNLLQGKDSMALDLRKSLVTNTENFEANKVQENLVINEYRHNLKDETTLYICIKMMAEPYFFENTLKTALFLVDVEARKVLNTPLPGFDYIKSAQGPEPKDWNNFVNNLIANKSLSRVNVPPYKYPQLKLLALRAPRLEIFKANETCLIDVIIASLKNKGDNDVQEITSKLKCYRDAEMYKQIKTY